MYFSANESYLSDEQDRQEDFMGILLLQPGSQDPGHLLQMAAML